ncbi:MAG: NADH-quinone oxidoreductase subunit NuoF [Pontiellaceae bacterium]|nr:NADH-quinone oxidoreductase subunit NuoF [Pontiellaceae bacterium]
MSKPVKIAVGMSSCNMAAGSRTLYSMLENAGLDAELGIMGCLGMCHAEPQVQVTDESGAVFLYLGLNPAKMEKVIAEHLRGGNPVSAWLFNDSAGDGAALMSKQKRIVLGNCGSINPESIDDYLTRDGYQALKKVLEQNDPMAVCESILASGLRGRGGAGFPTGLKWKFALGEKRDKKYVICNADEGDPGAFMDRSTLESDPHAVLEGMTIQAFATGASEGYIYCRAEYPLAVARLKIAIAQAEEKGFLGEHIFGSGFSLHLHVKEGAGAFVCGEETALMASVEGQRGMPRLRPPFPAQSGLFGRPTTINNVETLASVPWIIRNGAETYAAIGTEKSKGTKVFALAGKIKRGGLVEVPMGITIREIVEEIGGGTGTNRKIKAVQMGGPSGGCIPASLLDTRIDYDEVNRTGAIMGSGGMIVLDETTCMVDVARYFLDFTQLESCGKCTFCRIGTRRMLEILTRICEGNGVPEDIDMLEELAVQIKDTSLCGLGQTAPNPVLTTLKYFRDEYEEHINDKKCRAGKCTNLCGYEISDACTGCTVCARKCPVNAISGDRKAMHVIDLEVCVRCGVCRDVCKFDAVKVI